MDPLPEVKLVTFDAGNTLIHAYPSLGEVYSMVTRQHGAEVSPEIFRRVFVPAFHSFVVNMPNEFRPGSDENDRHMWRVVTRRIFDAIPQMSRVDFESWFDSLWTTFGSSRVWRYYADAPPALEALRARGIKIGIISNWDTRLRGILNELQTPVDFAVISSEVGYRKPRREIFARAEAHAGVKSSEALHIGDFYEEDVVGALASGWKAALIVRQEKYVPVPDGNFLRLHDLRELLNHL